MSRFSSERPHLRPLLSCGVRLGAESTDEKKPLEKTPGEKPIALWAISAPNGAGVLSNGYHFVGISPPTEQTVSQLIGVVSTPLKKNWWQPGIPSPTAAIYSSEYADCLTTNTTGD